MTTLLARLVEACSRRASLVTGAGIALIALSVLLATTRLGVTTDVGGLFSPKLAWKQREAAFQHAFPQNKDLIVAVIDARIPEEADVTAAELARRLSADTAHFRTVRQPDVSPYFDRNGLMFLDKDALTTLLNQTIDAQPFLGQLAADPSARGLFAALSLVAMGVERGEANLKPFLPALRGFHQALAGAASAHPQPLSWELLLSGSLAQQAGKYRFVLLQPKLDYQALEPGGAATRVLRETAAKLEFVRSGDARVRVTGSVPLADEEFATAAEGAVAGLVGSMILVLVWLFLAVHSWRLILPIVLTLILGLALTTAFATVAVGTLNLISVAFAILFVGIAVDFAIQFSVRLRDTRLEIPELRAALAETACRAGRQILVAAAATAAGFLAFVPTAFTGVAQLGLIAGVGMLIAFACTLTFLPAMLTLCRPHPESRQVGFAWARPLDELIVRRRRPVLIVFALLAVFGAVLLPRIVFDSDPLHTKDPHTEAMVTLRDLMADPITSPYSIDILGPSIGQAAGVAKKLQPLSLVDQVLTLNSFVPADQNDKLALIADAANILGPTLAPRAPAAPVSAADLRLATRTAEGQISRILPKLAPDDPLAAIAGDLSHLEGAPDQALLAMNAALTRFLPMQLARLRTALDAQPVTVKDVPPEIARDWMLPDGQARVQALAKRDAQDSAGLHAFVHQVQAVVPEAGGSAVTIVATADTIISAFRAAALSAIVAIAAILFAVLRRPLDVGLVMAPLLLSSLLTVLVVVLLPLPLNFANIIALPLLLGVGVSFNIYFVMNWRAGQRRPLGSATARAVVFSAFTTGTAFGSLALAKHPGTSSMGVLLLISLGCTLLATLVFVPAVLAAVPAPKTP